MADSLTDQLSNEELSRTLTAICALTSATFSSGKNGSIFDFVMQSEGVTFPEAVERLAAMDPPLGMGTGSPRGASRPWNSDDLLLVFTDGVSDARNRQGERLGEERIVELAKEHRADPPARVLERIFELLDNHTGDTRRRDDLTIVALRS